MHGFAFNKDSTTCAEINHSRGCVSGDEFGKCVCRAGYHIIKENNGYDRALLPAWQTPGFHPANNCEKDTNGKVNCLYIQGGKCQWCDYGFILNKSTDSCDATTAGYDANWDQDSKDACNFAAMNIDGVNLECVVSKPGAYIAAGTNQTSGYINAGVASYTWPDAMVAIDQCKFSYFQNNGLQVCHECMEGFVVNSNGKSCETLKTESTVALPVTQQALASDYVWLGCRQRANNKCIECKKGYFQYDLKMNNMCSEDSMMHCDEFLNTEKTTCKCRSNALQASKDNNRCEAVAKDNLGESFWNNQIQQSVKDNFGQCQKTHAVRMMLCEERVPLNGDNEDEKKGLYEISSSYVTLNKPEETNTAWDNYEKKVGDLQKQHEAWGKLGLTDSFCTLTAPE